MTAKPLLLSLALVLALTATALAVPSGEHVEFGIYNATESDTFDEILAWTHPARTETVRYGSPEQSLISAAQGQASAKAFGEFVDSRDATFGLLHIQDIRFRPGERIILFVPARSNQHEGWTVMLFYADRPGVATAHGASRKFAPPRRELLSEWLYGGHLYAGRSLVAVLQAERLTEVGSRRRVRDTGCPSWAPLGNRVDGNEPAPSGHFRKLDHAHGVGCYRP